MKDILMKEMTVKEQFLFLSLVKVIGMLVSVLALRDAVPNYTVVYVGCLISLTGTFGHISMVEDWLRRRGF